MRQSIIALAYATTVLADQGFIQKDGECVDPCLTFDDAQRVASNFGSLVATYSADKAQQVLTPGFTDYSDSVNELINYGCSNGPKALGAITFSNRNEFMVAQSSQPGIPFEVLNLWYACQGPVVIRWKSAQTPQPIVGNIVVEVQRNYGGAEPWLINEVFSEFNSGAWLVNQGTLRPTNCSAAAPPPPASPPQAAVSPAQTTAKAGGPPTTPAAASPAAGPPAAAFSAPAVASPPAAAQQPAGQSLGAAPQTPGAPTGAAQAVNAGPPTTPGLQTPPVGAGLPIAAGPVIPQAGTAAPATNPAGAAPLKQ